MKSIIYGILFGFIACAGIILAALCMDWSANYMFAEAMNEAIVESIIKVVHMF